MTVAALFVTYLQLVETQKERVASEQAMAKAVELEDHAKRLEERAMNLEKASAANNRGLIVARLEINQSLLSDLMAIVTMIFGKDALEPDYSVPEGYPEEIRYFLERITNARNTINILQKELGQNAQN